MCEIRVPPDRIIFVSPKKRFLTSDPGYNSVVCSIRSAAHLPEKLSRREFKQLSVRITTYLLPNDDKWVNYFTANVKKDDLADSYLQAIAWNVEKSNGAIDVDMVL
jgi:hypothetical protein